MKSIPGIMALLCLLSFTLSAKENNAQQKKIKYNGQVITRYQYNLDSKKDNSGNYEKDYDRGRARYRAVIGLDGTVNDMMKAGIAIAAGNPNPRTGYNDFGSSSSSKSIYMELLYAEITPAKFATILMGKMKNRLFRPNNSSDLVWSSSINPEGVFAQFNYTLIPNLNIFLNGSSFVLGELKTEDDPWMISSQIGLKYSSGNFFFAAAGSYYNPMNLDEQLAYSSESNSFETEKINGEDITTYIYDYDAIALGAEAGMFVSSYKLALYSEFISNISEGVEDKTGWLAGISAGSKKLSTLGDLTFSYDYRDMKKDAWLDTHTSVDLFSGKTGTKGHKFTVKAGLYTNFSLSVLVGFFEDTIASKKTEIAKFSLVYKF